MYEMMASQEGGGLGQAQRLQRGMWAVKTSTLSVVLLLLWATYLQGVRGNFLEMTRRLGRDIG